MLEPIFFHCDTGLEKFQAIPEHPVLFLRKMCAFYVKFGMVQYPAEKYRLHQENLFSTWKQVSVQPSLIFIYVFSLSTLIFFFSRPLSIKLPQDIFLAREKTFLIEAVLFSRISRHAILLVKVAHILEKK